MSTLDSNEDNSFNHDMESIDWDNFSFPTRPGLRSAKELLNSQHILKSKNVPGNSAASACSSYGHPVNFDQSNINTPIGYPKKIISWHLDIERWVLSHPGQRKKVELLRITTRRRLAMLVDIIPRQPTSEDQAALFRGINHAILIVFGFGIGEMLAMGPESWEWPMSVSQGGTFDDGSATGQYNETDEEKALRGRMGLSGI